jgi:hypothetical protein
MFGIFGDSLERLFIKETRERGIKLPKAAMKELVALAIDSVEPAHRALPGDYGRNLGEDAMLHHAGWTACVVHRAAGRPDRRTAIDRDLYPETEAAIRAILVKHGVLTA